MGAAGVVSPEPAALQRGRKAPPPWGGRSGTPSRDAVLVRIWYLGPESWSYTSWSFVPRAGGSGSHRRRLDQPSLNSKNSSTQRVYWLRQERYLAGV